MNATRFWAKVERRGDDECWEWKGYRGEDGAGRYIWGFPAHRTAWELANGRKVEKGKSVAQACENKGCCNPRHLVEVEGGEQLKSGRRGRITIMMAEQMIEMYASGKYRQTDIAEKFGIHQGQVNRILNRKSWHRHYL